MSRLRSEFTDARLTIVKMAAVTQELLAIVTQDLVVFLNLSIPRSIGIIPGAVSRRINGQLIVKGRGLRFSTIR
jgi:hypothetical protein